MSDKSVQLTADADGWYRWKTTLEEGFSLAPILTESHGLTNRRAPKCQVTVYPDKPPAVKVLSPDDQMAVRPDDTIQITFTARMMWASARRSYWSTTSGATGGRQEPVPIATIPIPLGDQAGARRCSRAVDLNMKQLGFEDGSEFSYEIRVREDRGGSPQEQVATTEQPTTPQANQMATTQQSTSPSANQTGPTQQTTSPSANQVATAAPQSPTSPTSTSPTSTQSGPQSNTSPTSNTAQNSRGYVEPDTERTTNSAGVTSNASQRTHSSKRPNDGRKQAALSFV